MLPHYPSLNPTKVDNLSHGLSYHVISFLMVLNFRF